MAATNNDYDIEVLGTCMTNPTRGSQHDAQVSPEHLWSFAQEEALVAVSERGGSGCYRLIEDPERRAKRIAARYADLYFKSAEKSGGKLQMYWVGLAAFVVKDIVEAFRYARAEVLSGGWRNWDAAKLGSMALTGASPYEHAMRVYAALAKGNIWLFMDIYPWLWFVLEYGLTSDGRLLEGRLNSHVGTRDSGSLQKQSKRAIEELVFGPSWLQRLKAHMASDPVYAHAKTYFSRRPVWVAQDGGYGQHQANALQAHQYVKKHIASHDRGFRTPSSQHWGRFSEAFYVLEEERKELGRIAEDSVALGKLEKVAKFGVTPEIRNAYAAMIRGFNANNSSDRRLKQRQELVEIAKQEQLNVLQTLIYDDAELHNTMDKNHRMSRRWGSWLSPHYAVVYSANPTTDDPELQTVFDPPTGAWNRWVEGATKSLPNPTDRMEYVGNIAKDYNKLMARNKRYMEDELRKIRGWLNA